MAKDNQPERPGFFGTLKQVGMVASMTAKRDKWFIPLIAGVVVVVAGLTVLATLAWSWIFIPLGVMLAVLGALIVLNLRANTAFMAEAEGMPGAAVGIIQNMRGDYRVTPTVQATTDGEMVHLVICRGGIILLGEGPNIARVRSLIGQERRRLSKVIGSTDLRDFIIGNEDGELPLKKLRSTLLRMPRTLAAKDVYALDTRIKALSARPNMPKGAIPKNMRPPKGAFKAMRGR
jgi:hypothetical protein